MLKIDSEMFHNLNAEAIKDNKKDTFVDAFTEFITELDDIDLSEKTKQHLYGIFVKDMNIYFENKKYETDYIPKSKIKEKIKELEHIRNTALTGRTMEMMDDKISILELILEEC